MFTFDDNDIDWLSDLLASAAEAEIMPRFRTLGEHDVRAKTSDLDLVTEADVNAERVITAHLLARYPDALVVGEEASESDASLPARLADAPLAFVVDPVDGTYNFAHGVPLFGVMVAVVVNGETRAGIIHDPIGRDWIIGVKGAGTRIRTSSGNSRTAHVAPPTSPSNMLGSISWQFVEEPLRSTLARNHARCASSFGFRCAAHEYRLIATGGAHFSVYHKLMPWDHLAGVLIHQEAGGYAARFDGSPYLPGHVDGGILTAPDQDTWHELRHLLFSD
ncbi:fructose-1,6-bisphosphatase/inositol monophosphatase family enzyme [Rhodococcus sp. 27YEA15]|uniref:inositol monophosphatase family protein n=1 Tax=Rhodococcus sp. 27YEA15 TaxID=3156259 RepID=UPI003C7E5886